MEHSPRAEAGGTNQKSRYVMIGGFLGAGKTTAVAAVAQHFAAQGLRVGLITNDQGSELVDTTMLRSKGFATEEITGGCFCCRFNTLTDAAQKLTDTTRPDVFIAEPVGSCTDLVATVTYPLRRIYGDAFTIAPLSVLVDPVRAERFLGLASGGKFSDKVTYIYRKQLEEADIIVITKTDVLDAALSEDGRPAGQGSQASCLTGATPVCRDSRDGRLPSLRLEQLRARLAEEFPHAEILGLSVRKSDGLAPWFDLLATGEQSLRATMEVDYELYAEGEALLGWLNATVQLAAPSGFDSDATLKMIASGIQQRLAGAEIAHLKMTLSPDSGLGDIAAINLVRSDFVPELSLTLDEPVESGQLIINCRAEAAPEAIRDAVRATIAALNTAAMSARLDHLEFFRPGKPQPTHRDTVTA